MKDGHYNRLLMCNIISTSTALNTVNLYLPEYDEPDMTGAIAYAQQRLPEVTRINVFNGVKQSDGYALSANGRWKCDRR